MASQLALTVDQFRRLMVIRKKLAQAQTPSQSEWLQTAMILAGVYKILTLYPQWLTEENTTFGNAYWMARKARLPRWRASIAQRRAWQQALTERSKPPIIDPDLISSAYIRSRTDNPAFSLHQTRAATIGSQLNTLRGYSKNLAGFEAMVDDTIGPWVDGLATLAEQRDQGKGIARRLDQLSLASAAFGYLVHIRELLTQTPTPPILDSEWEDVNAILTQVWKRRQSADWQIAEQQSGLTLAPDFFRVPAVDPTVFPPTPPRTLPAWRASRNTLHEWEDTLDTRIDAEKSVIGGYYEMIDACEEALLPSLRDALVQATNAVGTTLHEKAAWITEHLLIDAAVDGCQKTSRISQAIETLQGILWSVRTGLLNDTEPSLKLVAERFDEAWKWIGSYATWRAALGVFLYPENILLPTLRRFQTPAFKRMVETLRSTRPLTPKRARESAEEYAIYLRDVSSLELKASVSVEFQMSDGQKWLTYLLGRGGETGMIYWRTWGAAGLGIETRVFWDAVPGLQGEATVYGTAIYRPAIGLRYLYFIASLLQQGKQALMCLRYDLQNRKWVEPISLSLPEKVTEFTAVVEKQSDEAKSPRITLAVPGGIFYQRSLSADGRDWAEGDWKPMDRLWSKWQTHNVGTTKLVSGSYLTAVLRDPSIDFYATNSSGQVVQIPWNGFLLNNNFQPAKLVGPASFTAPAGAPVTGVYRNLSSTTQQDIFVVDTTGRTFTLRYDLLSGWASQWTKIEYHYSTGYVSYEREITTPGSMIAVVSRAPTVIDALVVDTAVGKMMRAARWTQATNKWTNWEAYYANSLHAGSTAVNAVALAGNRFHAFAVNSDGEVMQQIWINPNWYTPVTIPNSPIVPVNTLLAAVARSPYTIDVFVTDNQGDVRTACYDGPDWSGWRQVSDGTMKFPPGTSVTAISRSPGHLVVFAVDKDGVIYSTWQDDGLNDGKWHSWYPVGDPTKDTVPVGSKVTAVLSFPYGNLSPATQFMLFVIGDDGNIRWIESSEGMQPLAAPSSIGVLPPKPGATALLITDQLTDAQRAQRASEITQAFTQVYAASWSEIDVLNTYLEEAFYFVPVHLALQLQKSGEYIAALDWLRLVYDYTLPESQREVYGLAKPNAQNPQDTPYQRQAHWLLDPLNPHLIACTRAGTYDRFTLLATIRCLLDYADSEFTRDTAETLPRARALYMTALALLDTPDLQNTADQCSIKVDDVKIVVGEDQWVESSLIDLLLDLRKLHNPSHVAEAVNRVNEVIAFHEDNNGGSADFAETYLNIKAYLARERAAESGETALGALVIERDEKLLRLHNELLTIPRISEMVEGASIEARPSAEVAATLSSNGGDGPRRRHIEARAMTASPIIGTIDNQPTVMGTTGHWIPAPVFQFCIVPNPIVQALRLRANLNLYKLRTCRNIAGMERALEPYAAATDTISALPTIGAGGQLVVAGAARLQPTAYRYTTLVERAKQIVQLAMNLESTMLATLEKRDAELYSQLKARQDMHVAKAGVTLQTLRIHEAEGQVHLAELQRARSEMMVQQYEEWLEAEMLQLETDLIEWYHWLAGFQAAGAIAEGVIRSLSVPPQLGFWGSAAYFAAVTAQAGSGILASIAQANINELGVRISHERRKQEWEFQRILAQQDVRIGDEQAQLAQDQVRVVEQEKVIAELQADSAQAGLDFLTNKFTNPDLYDWMSGILESVYSYFLQQATSVALLASDQLAFERQEPLPTYIQADYWEAPSEDGIAASSNGKAPDRRGLTGSARLLQDIYQLDQYAFETNRRKQQLTRVISLAQLDPIAFQQFRETGVMTFATPMELFDRDFPGHYLRLMRRVQASVIALIPPGQGIRATLSSGGVSRVVLGGDVFQTQPVRRDPETVALSSPMNATGLFELEGPSEMMFPFEGMGVDAMWEFRMLRGSNPIDYSTIADVLLTFEYTALNSFTYRQQIVQTLNRRVSADRGYSFRHHLADAWYDFHNPDQAAAGRRMIVRFETTAADFPPNVENPKIQHIALYFARTDGSSFEIPVTYLRFTEQGSNGSVGGAAISVNGLISTRQGNAGSWNALLGRSPVGTWEIALPDIEEIRDRFKQNELDDMLLVITYSGLLPEWAP